MKSNISKSWFVLAVFGLACTRPEGDSPTSGSLTIMSAECLAPVAQKQIAEFQRLLYLFSQDRRLGVAVGLIAFVTSAAGQKLILNAGLVPATMPVKLVHCYLSFYKLFTMSFRRNLVTHKHSAQFYQDSYRMTWRRV